MWKNWFIPVGPWDAEVEVVSPESSFSLPLLAEAAKLCMLYASICCKNHLINMVSWSHVSNPSMAPISPLVRCFLRAGSCRTQVVRNPSIKRGDDGFGHKKWIGKWEIYRKSQYCMLWQRKTWSLVEFPLSIGRKKSCIQHLIEDFWPKLRGAWDHLSVIHCLSLSFFGIQFCSAIENVMILWSCRQWKSTLTRLWIKVSLKIVMFPLWG